ncbi:MAG: hypothetical protein V2A61_07425 [Calditrichota bacterium]
MLEYDGDPIGDPINLNPAGGGFSTYTGTFFDILSSSTWIRVNWNGGPWAWGWNGEGEADPDLPPGTVSIQYPATSISVWCSFDD